MALVSRVCPECLEIFQRQSWDVKKYEKKGKLVYCSHSCSSKVSNKNRYPKRKLTCAGCKKEVIVNESSQKDKYCSKPCYFEHQKDRLADQARKTGKDSAKKISETKKQMYASGALLHPLLGKKHKESTKRKIRESHKKYYEIHDGHWKGKKLPEETKAKISETRTQNWIDGKYDHLKTCWAKGRYFFQKANKEVWYRSSWELAFMKYLDNNLDVKRCEYENVRIPYYDTAEKKRNYIPDVLIEYNDGRKVLCEIKPFARKNSETNKRKFFAARKFCKQRDIKFKVITEKYLKHVGAMK